jgi:hypothetical protein
MAEDRSLETCVACDRPFVVPTAMLDLVDEGLYLLALQCRNCDQLSTAIVEDADLEALEHANEAATAEMEAALEIVSVARFIEDF